MTVCVTAAAYAQSPPSATDRTRNAKTAARIERHRLASKENNLFVTGASGITAHNQVTVGVKVEYSRQLKGNFYWGVDFSARWHLGSLMSYDWSGHGSDPYRNTVAQDIYKLDAMAYYRLPVVKSSCPADGSTSRQRTKELIARLEKDYPDLKSKVMGAVERAGIAHWDAV